ncbi:MAG: RelA/SpoT family protein [Thermonema sp.]|uniref:RelA/SpoT family protein n=1 Tax=Thermonema sp. TaxID=2231181 RepID=UPI0021DE8262|nr:bifunctional (p)ppGpp synthetase/guanosine-3',5'-bis(diphosphate) 3'-pyrophosphohydrolase [Thermonema sp.]GIV40397.1 MAG: RelA/SpoT family protein [Thermonema sp.]
MKPIETNKPNLNGIDEEAERREILKRYRKLMRIAKPYLKEGDAGLIKRAFKMAAEAHKDMRRKSGEPYIFHPLAVAQICVEEMGLGATSIAAALLHDVVEDTDITLEEIEREFGSKIARIIDGLTKITDVEDSVTSSQAENFKKVILTLAEDVRVILIKIADRLHNMRTLESMAKHKQLKIASETIYIYAPLAHRLGLYSIKSELEDLYLRYTSPSVYNEIVEKIEQTKASRDKFIRDFIRPIRKALKEEGYKFEIKGRMKSVFSIYQKMQKQKIPFEQVYDLFAIRIILDDVPPQQEKAACWKVYSIVTDFYLPNPDRLRDWISTPRANGYESLHTTVMSRTGQWVEVQIRTRRMDDIAERGYAAHWRYKESGVQVKKGGKQSLETGLEMWLNRVRELLEKNGTGAIEFIDDFRSNFFSDEIYVFTPKGDLKVLPQGATALDFAFEIHTDIGKTCIGAKVNNKLVSINYELKNGDQVEILTSAKQKPSIDWLSFVKTSKAKHKIKEALREEKRAFMKLGREMANKKLQQWGVPCNDRTYEQMRAFFNEKTVADLFYDIGSGELPITELKRFKEILETKGARKGQVQQMPVKKENKDGVEQPEPPKKKQPSDSILIGDDYMHVPYTLAKCCNPIPGDEIFGFATANEGIKIHRTTCPNATELLSKHGNRVIKATWASVAEESFLVGLYIKGTDRVGIVNDVSKVISNDLKVNMRSIAIDTSDTLFEGTCTVMVANTEALKQLIEKLKAIPGVEEVKRLDY